MTPRLFIDARWSGEAGLGRYVDQLIAHLLELDHGMRIFVGVRRGSDPELRWSAQPDVEIVELRSRWFTLSEQLEMPRALRKIRADVGHFTNVNAPLAAAGQIVTTIHDLTTLTWPTELPGRANRLRGRSRRSVLRSTLPLVLRTSSAIIVPTSYVAGELRRAYPSAGARFVVTPEAGNEMPEPALTLPDGVIRPFVLTAGKAYPHKNLARLLDAFAIVDSEPGLSLVLVGPEDAHRAALRRLVDDHPAGRRCLVLGDVDDAALSRLYHDAECFVFPSLSEGFGLPGLEAMACGAPVASSNATCLPEVYGDAAVYFDPLSPSEMAVAIESVVTDPHLRVRLIAAGARQAGSYSWRRMAEQTLEVYRDCLG